MARGDGGKTIFEADEDRKSFLFRLRQVCGSHGWRIHAWVLMGNHMHLLLETPEPNLVTGMKWLLGTFAQGWNARRLRQGHVFQGRYKSVPVSAATESPYYFRIVADYIHLNAARAGLAGGSIGKLISYKWSSLPDYARGKGPDWLVTDRVLNAFELAKDGRGRRAYVAWLEKRAANDGGKIDEEAMKALRRGWYLGEPTFADKLRALVDRGESVKAGSDAAARAHGEAEAEDLVKRVLGILGLPTHSDGLSGLRKGDRRKVLVAVLLRERTSVGNGWIARRLEMGHTGALSRLIGGFRKDKANVKELNRLVAGIDEKW
ncbi:MAG: transposase [Akkermansiaceae bacterium]|nr:transposase [Akkermansiaceae bacterium]